METPLTPNQSQQMAAHEPDSAEASSYEKGVFLHPVTKCLLMLSILALQPVKCDTPTNPITASTSKPFS